MELKQIEHEFSVCKVRSYAGIDLEQAFCFLGKTDEEHALVCLTENVPGNTIEREDGWKAFRIQGVLDFSLIGILAKISTVLAENQIGIFAISTFNTDYILVKADQYQKALDALRQAGYRIV
ncbi:MAG: ACT domain-containing protein [Lachnospiraceae bacterium]|nr:ACT domain-containing protein [Lachnospiraceae bacterium]